MKTSHRHDLKTNEVAEQLARATGWVSGRQNQVVGVVIAIVVVIAAAVAFWNWRQGGQERAGAALAEALAVADAQIIPPESAEIPRPDTFSSESARATAALEKLRVVMEQYPSTEAATAARFRAATLLAGEGKGKEAEQYFREVASRDNGIHGRMARMAVAELQVQAGQYDEAINTFRDLAARKDGDLPVDGVLMQLARAYEKAGKRAEALQTYQRVTSEFPDSIYAGEAKQAADGLKGGTAS
jgi:hypothetical protein